MQNRANRHSYARVRKSRPDPFPVTFFPMPRVDDNDVEDWMLAAPALTNIQGIVT